MAFTVSNFIEPSQDATAFKISDRSNWSDDAAPSQASIVTAQLSIEGDPLDSAVTYDILTNGGDRTNFNEYLDNSGHEVKASDLGLDDFQDGYYKITLTMNDGADDYTYANEQAFLAYARLKARRLPLLLDEDDLVYKDNETLYSINMYLKAAELAVEMGMKDDFDIIMERINEYYNTYGISLTSE
jgi:hypothetical protein